MIELPCDQTDQLIFEYLDIVNKTDLSGSEKESKESFERRLAECENCRKELDINKSMLKYLAESRYKLAQGRSVYAEVMPRLKSVMPKKVQLELLRKRIVKYGSVALAGIFIITALVVISPISDKIKIGFFESADNANAAMEEYSGYSDYNNDKTAEIQYSGEAAAYGNEETAANADNFDKRVFAEKAEEAEIPKTGEIMPSAASPLPVEEDLIQSYDVSEMELLLNEYAPDYVNQVAELYICGSDYIIPDQIKIDDLIYADGGETKVYVIDYLLNPTLDIGGAKEKYEAPETADKYYVIVILMGTEE